MTNKIAKKDEEIDSYEKYLIIEKQWIDIMDECKGSWEDQ